MQATLLEFRRNFVNGFRDSAFSGNRELPLHRWVPWIAGFSAQFVDDCLKKYLRTDCNADASVLDPFCEVGTTLVEAFTRGFNVAGLEINPYAAQASKVKLQAAKIGPAALRPQITGFQKIHEAPITRFVTDMRGANQLQ